VREAPSAPAFFVAAASAGAAEFAFAAVDPDFAAAGRFPVAAVEAVCFVAADVEPGFTTEAAGLAAGVVGLAAGGVGFAADDTGFAAGVLGFAAEGVGFAAEDAGFAAGVVGFAADGRFGAGARLAGDVAGLATPDARDAVRDVPPVVAVLRRAVVPGRGVALPVLLAPVRGAGGGVVCIALGRAAAGSSSSSEPPRPRTRPAASSPAETAERPVLTTVLRMSCGLGAMALPCPRRSSPTRRTSRA
jgi:hypothetical protein